MKKNKNGKSQKWGHGSMILLLGRLRQEDYKFQASIVYIMELYRNTTEKGTKRKGGREEGKERKGDGREGEEWEREGEEGNKCYQW